MRRMCGDWAILTCVGPPFKVGVARRAQLAGRSEAVVLPFGRDKRAAS